MSLKLRSGLKKEDWFLYWRFVWRRDAGLVEMSGRVAECIESYGQKAKAELVTLKRVFIQDMAVDHVRERLGGTQGQMAGSQLLAEKLGTCEREGTWEKCCFNLNCWYN